MVNSDPSSAAHSLPPGAICDNGLMAMPPVAPISERKLSIKIFRRTKVTVLLALVALLILCAVFSWTTREAMQHFQLVRTQAEAPGIAGTRKTLVDISPWQTAESLAPLAVTAEEKGYAQEAERLTDHEVDQAFASALRLAILQSQRRTLTGDALALAQKLDQLQQLVSQDQDLVRHLSAAPTASAGAKDDAQAGAG